MTHKKTDEGYPIFRSYLETENDEPYYSMNTLSFYYEDMARKQKLIEDLAKAIAGYDQTLTGNLQAIEQQVAERFEQWDEKLKTFDGSVMDLLKEWVDDGTMDHIVDSSIVDRKLEPITAQLADIAVNPENFKLPSDTSDDLMINRAINSINKGRILLKADYTYICKSPIVLKDGVTLSGYKNTKLDFTTATLDSMNACVYNYYEALVPLPTLSMELAKNSSSIAFTSVPNIKQKDIIAIHDNTDFSYSSYRNYYKKGEFAVVESLTNSTASLTSNLYDSYNSTTSTYKMPTVTIDVTGLEIVAKNNSVGVKIIQGHLCNINNLKVSGSGNALVQLIRCFECKIDNVHAYDNNNAVGLNYGVSIANSQIINIDNCYLSTTRHGLALGGNNENGSITNREIRIKSCYIESLLKGVMYSADIHGNSEFVSYENCTIKNGISIGGNNIAIKNCTIFTMSNGVAVYFSEMLGSDVEIEGNTFIINNPIAPSRSIIDFQMQDKLTVQGTVIIRDNRVKAGLFTGKGIYIYNIASPVRHNIIIAENVMGFDTHNATNVGIYLRCGVGFSLGSINVFGNSLSKAYIYLQAINTDFINIEHNKVYNSSLYGIDITANSSPAVAMQIIILADNTIIKPLGCGIRVQGLSREFSILKLNNNTSINCANEGSTGSSNTDSSLNVLNVKDFVMQSNLIGDSKSTPTQTRLYALVGVTNFFERDTYNIGSVVLTNITDVTNTL